MTIEKIICDLKEVKDIEQLQVLICKLEESLNEKIILNTIVQKD